MLLSLNAPVPTTSGYELPLRLSGADRLGAARMNLTFPAGNYRVASVQARDLPSGWMLFDHEEEGRLFIGLLAGIRSGARGLRGGAPSS